MARAENHIGLPKQVIIIIMIVFLLLLQLWSSHCCLEKERVALMQLRDSFNFPNGAFLVYWGLNTDCCKWNEVVCDNTTGRVTELQLYYVRHKSLGDWNFNASLFLPFQQLRSLVLRGNEIVCCAENEGFQGLQKLSNLETLDLGNNNLSNNILPMFFGFQSLKSLSLLDNKLSGSIYVKDLVNIPNLEELILGANHIEKFVLSEDTESSSNISSLWLNYGVCNGSSFELQSLRAFQNLKSLHLEFNNFNGVIFPADGLNKLEELFLGYSDMDENFLQSIGTLQSLRLLNLAAVNHDTFTTFQSFPNFKNLKVLYLNYTTVGNAWFHSIANTTSLEALGLSACKLSGSIDELCKLKNLQSLDLGGIGIRGTLPSCFANLTLLHHLDLYNNNFTGNISESTLMSLTSIEYLGISNNQFRIPISLSPFFNHSKLKYLYVGNNEIYAESGGVDDNLTPKFQLEELRIVSTYGGLLSFPRFLYHQYGLKYLGLFDIQMRGAGFPSWLIDNNTKLETIYLSNCSLSGTLHLPVHPHAKLKYLEISNNHLYGHIPTEIGSYFPMLESLILSRNNFVGKIPNSLFNCSILRELDMDDNRLFGIIPEWIGNMSFLELLDLSNNNFSGSLPSIFVPPQARNIFLSYNKLEGPLPKVFPKIDLSTLDLSHNCFNGSIPKSMENLYSLTYVLLSHNNFEGEIPFFLWKMTKNLMVVDLSHNRFCTLSFKNYTSSTSQGYSAAASRESLELVVKGNTHPYGTTFMCYNKFIGLDLSSNNLTCSIPFEIGNKKGMKTLNLSHNNLMGYIPLSFSNMTEVENLDLSYNNLNGTLPPQLVQLKFLQVFSVAYNNLSGKTLERVAQFATFDESSYQGNPFLCGLPLPKDCTPTSSITKESSTVDTDSDGFIDMEVFQISFWVTFTIILLTIALVLYINSDWRQAWFYFIEVTITSCYYFLVDHLPFLSKFGITQFL